MTRMFWINGSLESDPAIDRWLAAKPGALQQIAVTGFTACDNAVTASGKQCMTVARLRVWISTPLPM